MGTGIVSASYGAYYGVLPLPELEPELRCRLRGKLRLRVARKEWMDRVLTRHPVIVGDKVEITREQTPDATIDHVVPRKNAVCRSTGDELQALGANIDRAVLVVSLADPGPRFSFVDRVLASCYAADVETILLFSKLDLADPEDLSFEMIELYKSLGYDVRLANLTADPPGKEIVELIDQVKEGTTLFIGNSGTGKSTLLNLLLGEEVQKTGTVSRTTGLGKHTTTNSRLMLSLDRKAFYIDTPGVADFGVSHLDRHTVLESFPELRAAAEKCEFRDCKHEEKSQGCAIQEILHEPDSMDPDRYTSLFAMLDSLEVLAKIRTGDYIKATGRIRTGRIKKHE